MPPNLFTIHSSRFSKSARYRYRVETEAQPKAPLAKGGWFGEAKPGGFRRLAGFHIGLYFWESACCVIPQSRLTPCQLPLAREPFGARYCSMVRYRAFSIFQSTAWDKNVPKSYKSITGAEAKTPHPSQSEGSIPVGSTRGILKGGTIRAGASCSPLEPASLHTFLPEQESMALLASACRKPIGQQAKRL